MKKVGHEYTAVFELEEGEWQLPLTENVLRVESVAVTFAGQFTSYALLNLGLSDFQEVIKSPKMANVWGMPMYFSMHLEDGVPVVSVWPKIANYSKVAVRMIVR